MKSFGKGKLFFLGLYGPREAYDRVDRDTLWQVMQLYGAGGKLLKAVQSFYVDSRACVRIGNDVSEWFSVNVGVRKSVK